MKIKYFVFIIFLFGLSLSNIMSFGRLWRSMSESDKKAGIQRSAPLSGQEDEDVVKDPFNSRAQSVVPAETLTEKKMIFSKIKKITVKNDGNIVCNLNINFNNPKVCLKGYAEEISKISCKKKDLLYKHSLDNFYKFTLDIDSNIYLRNSFTHNLLEIEDEPGFYELCLIISSDCDFDGYINFNIVASYDIYFDFDLFGVSSFIASGVCSHFCLKSDFIDLVDLSKLRLNNFLLNLNYMIKGVRFFTDDFISGNVFETDRGETLFKIDKKQSNYMISILDPGGLGRSFWPGLTNFV